jgi:cyclopropane fatty-acyl-phospholipid synthase-like methyltransferase
MNLLFTLLVFVFVAYAVIFVVKTKTGSPSVWSKDSHIKHLLKYVTKGMKVADLGAGDGRVLIDMVQVGALSGEGWEIEPIVWAMAQREIRKQKLDDRIKVHFSDMWQADLSQYDLVYVYQLTQFAPRFVAKAKREMKKGSLVIANTYPLEGLPILKTDHELFVYRMH